jgi:hypothetical protein
MKTILAVLLTALFLSISVAHADVPWSPKARMLPPVEYARERVGAPFSFSVYGGARVRDWGVEAIAGGFLAEHTTANRNRVLAGLDTS